MLKDIIRYYETSGEVAQDIVKAALPELNPDVRESTYAMLDLGRDRSFNYDLHFVPHDVQVREWGAGGQTARCHAQGVGHVPFADRRRDKPGR